MCIICVLWEIGKLTKKEAKSALKELRDVDSIKDKMHAIELEERLSRTYPEELVHKFKKLYEGDEE